MYRVVWILIALTLVLGACAAPAAPAAGQPTGSPTLPLQPGTVAPAMPTPTLPAADAPTQAPTAGLDGEQFDQALAAAIERRDFAALEPMLGEPFGIGMWQSEGGDFNRGEALEQLRLLLPESSRPQVVFDQDLAALLGADPLLIFGPDTNAVRAFLIRGVAQDATSEAIAVIARDPETGELFWRGLLLGRNGFDHTGQPTGQPQGAFDQQLMAAFQARDLQALRALMSERFIFLTYNTELLGVPADEGLDRLERGILAPGAQPVLQPLTDLNALLGGVDPYSIWGPVDEIVGITHFTGLGAGADEEALVAIGRERETGRLVFHGVVLPQNGLFSRSTPMPEPPVGDVLETDVRAVMALEAVNLRSGPGLNYASEGAMRAGEIATVTGKSADGQWWRIACTSDISGSCWVSADPALTEPATP